MFQADGRTSRSAPAAAPWRPPPPQGWHPPPLSVTAAYSCGFLGAMGGLFGGAGGTLGRRRSYSWRPPSNATTSCLGRERAPPPVKVAPFTLLISNP